VSNKCVMCESSADCSSMSSACKEGYCDSAMGTCKQRSKADHTSCSADGATGVCSAGTCISGCINATDCSTDEACQSGKCVASARCGNGTVEGSEACDDGNQSNEDTCLNTCVKAKCGDRYLNRSSEGPEACDTSAGQGDAWTCSSNCERLYLYTPCSGEGANNPDCNGGTCNSGLCYPACSGSGQCSLPNGRIGQCILYSCITRCDAGGTTCPPVATCKPSASPDQFPYRYCFQ
jgi:cysteine-rich repeat protein